jgi:transporter family protein
MSNWFLYAVGAALLYGAHQIFTKLASDRISDGLGGFVVEASAALTILLYLAYLKFFATWNQTWSLPGFGYSVITGICVGVGTIFFFLLFQKGGPQARKRVRFLHVRRRHRALVGGHPHLGGRLRH